jgi:AAA15 family ATPase/GTPase
MKSKLPLISFRLQNFKAVQDSKTIKFGPFTARIGNNYTGKSSIVEGQETLQVLALYGINATIQLWRGSEHIWNQDKDLSSTKTRLD